MTVTKGVALAFALAAAGALLQAGATGSSTVPSARLKTISSRTDSKGTSIVVEATEPVPYLMTRPDPLTVVLEFRNVDAQSVTKKIAAVKGGPISEVTVENADSLGAPSSRVRIALAEPVAHRVRSDKNQIIVEFDKKDGKSAPYVAPPLSRDAAEVVQFAAGQGVTGAADPIAALSLQALAAPAAAQAVPTQPAAQQVTQQPAAVTDGKKYTGAPISLTFEDADLKSVLALFADEEGINLATDPGVQGTVNVRFTAVPWDQALDQILRMNKLGSVIDGTIVRIAPISVLSAESDDRRKLADAQANEGELRTMTKPLSYAKAEDMAPLLTKSSTLSLRGSVQIDSRTNTLIITDLQTRLNAANDLIVSLDTPQPQVMIEARIVQTNKSYGKQIGVQWGFAGRVDPALGNTTGLAFPNSGTLAGGTGGSQNSIPSAVNLPIAGATSAVGLALGSVNGAFNLDVALSALEKSGNGRVLATPRVTTQNNVEAEMQQGTQIPIQTVANNTTTVTFKDAALTLKVTPQITAAGTVIMTISVENSQADFSRSINGIPPINTQKATTRLLVSDGETTVIGGVNTSSTQTTRDSTPGLSRVPLLSWLFKRDLVDDTNTELLIFITPKIIKG